MTKHAVNCPVSLGLPNCTCGASPDVPASDVEDFLAGARVVMKRCQVGTNDLYAAHDILAACYGTIGRLITMAEGGQTLAEQPANAT